jgi:predicted ATPase/DNA-binding SARP family transcriptional activator
VNFRLLGPLEVEGPLGQIRLDGKRRRLFLLRLLTSPNLVLSDDRLAEDVWEGHPPEGVLSTLSSHVSLIRQAIGKERIRRKSGGYLMVVDLAEIDATCFSSEVDAGRTAWASGDRHAARELLAGALSRWRGPALADAGECAWAIGPRTRWEELRRAAEEELGEVRLQLGEHRQLVPMLEDAVAAEPLRERRWAQLMLAMYRSGLQADALNAYQRVRALLDEELGLEPSVELAHLEQRILRQDAELDWSAGVRVDTPQRPSGRHHIGLGASRQGDRPSRRTRMIGRERELDHLLSSIQERQVVTLTGIGGIGKSRLASEVTLWAERSYSEGSRWVELSSLTDSSDVHGAVAGALGIRITSPDMIVDTITEWLSDRRELLVLDNCEHVLPAVTGLVDVITSRCPGVTVLATSRILLGLPGEVVWTVRSLHRDDAFALFEERVFEIDPELSLGEGDRELIHRICDRLDGHPLAIEIAAAQVRSRSIEDILEVLPREWGEIDAETMQTRHRSLDESVAWSVRLLDDDSRRLFQDLAVFPSGFELDAALTVCDDEAMVRRIPFELAVLVSHSMIQIDRSATTTRYRVLEAMRDFGRRSEGVAARQKELQTRHCDYYRRHCVEVGRATLGPGYHGNGSMVRAEWDNFRAAMDHAIKDGDHDSAVDFVVPIGQWAIRALQSEHRLWVARCLELVASRSQIRPSLLALAAKWLGLSGDHEGARRLALDAIAAAAPDSTAAAMSWVAVAFSNGMTGRRKDVARAIAEAEAALDSCGDGFTFVEGHAVLHPLIVIATPDRQGSHRDAVHRAALDLDNSIANAIVHRMDVVEHIRGGMIEKAVWLLPAAIEAASRAQVASIEMDLEAMALLLMSPDDPTADERLLRILSALKAYDYGDTILRVLEYLGIVWARRGIVDRAATVLGHLQANNLRYPNPFGQLLRAEFLDPVASEPEAVASLESGAAMTRSELVNYAIELLGSG